MINREAFLSTVREAKEKQEQEVQMLRDRLSSALAENEDMKTALEILGVTTDGSNSMG